MIRGREDIAFANRIVIKAGTSVVSTPDGYPSLSRMASIVENTARLVHQGKEVMIVTSGAVGVGRQRLSKQSVLKKSMSDLISQRDSTVSKSIPTEKGKVSYNSACAAAGQLGLMSLYETMFSQFDITISQILVTSFDFTSPERRRNIQYVITQLLSLGIVPLLNENDPVSLNQGYETFGSTFSDNDSLASIVSVEMGAQLLILLTDVKGVYDRPPSEKGAVVIDVYNEKVGFKVGEKSLQGRGGMGEVSLDTGTLFTGAYPGGASPNKIGRVGLGVSSRVYRATFSGAGAWCCCCCDHRGAVVGGGAPIVPPALNTALRAGSFKISVTLASHCFVGSPAWLTKF